MTIGQFSIIDDAGRKHGKHHPSGPHTHGTRGFTAVDGEGVTFADGTHEYVLFGAASEQIEEITGLNWRTVFEHIESVWTPGRAIVGFYLGYDFTQWLKTMPESRVRSLLTIDGKARRKSRSPKMKGRYLPVDIDDWQMDVIGSKRFAIRRHPCRCLTFKCDHSKGPWIYVCDAGPFFQTSFINVINPAKWTEPIVTPEEWATILEGKDKRATAQLDDDMRRYNKLENEIMARVMDDLDRNFRKLGIQLSPSQWYGPGQAAQYWLNKHDIPTAKMIGKAVPTDILNLARESYYGGHFEIFAHGIIPGTSHEYDINSAYPKIISELPCLLHGSWETGSGTPRKLKPREICLVRARVWTRPPHADTAAEPVIMGAMLHRDADGRICRPQVTEGVYWWHELQAARRAGCLAPVTPDRIHEWAIYTPCACPPPLREVASLYQLRLTVGKNSSLGKAAKLIINSIYGKFAQSVGHPKFGNPIYASLITAGCRTMVLNAIATHPRGIHALLMVATDAVFFTEPHPTLPISTNLGEWSHESRERLTLFKPGVYWDDAARSALREGKVPSLKSRGISARDFAHSIFEIDAAFEAWGQRVPPNKELWEMVKAGRGHPVWPKVIFATAFAMTTALQALMQNDWSRAGHVQVGKELTQSSDPYDKRTNPYYDSVLGIVRTEAKICGPNATMRGWGNLDLPLESEDYRSVPYEKRFGMEDPFSDESVQEFGISPDEYQPAHSAFRFLTGKEI